MTTPKERRRFVRLVEAEGDTFGPPCACGCLEPVRMGTRGYTAYVNRAHRTWDRQASGGYAEMSQVAHTKDMGIPIETFRKAIRSLQDEKLWSLREVAERGGQQPGWLHNYMYSDRVRSIGEDTARSFLRRIAGMGEKPSRFQQRTVPVQVSTTDRVIAAMGMDNKRPMNQQRKYVRSQ